MPQVGAASCRLRRAACRRLPPLLPTCTCATFPAGYPCTPARPADCPKPPGGLALQQVPQFIAITWDDAVTSQSFGIVQQILGGLKQRNGCPIPSTYFVTAQGVRGSGACDVPMLRVCRWPPRPCPTCPGKRRTTQPANQPAAAHIAASPRAQHPCRHGPSGCAGALPGRQRDCDAHTHSCGVPQRPGGCGLPRLAGQQDGHPQAQGQRLQVRLASPMMGPRVHRSACLRACTGAEGLPTCSPHARCSATHRAPFLLHNSATRRALAAAGFLYDSSMPDTAPSAVSSSVRQRAFPYRMDAGIPQSCETGGWCACGTELKAQGQKCRKLPGRRACLTRRARPAPSWAQCTPAGACRRIVQRI